MRRRADAGRRERNGARFLLGERDEVLDRFDAELGRNHQHFGHFGDQRDRREIAERIERHVRHDVRRHRHRTGGGEKQRVAVGIGFGHVAAAQRAVGAGLVVDIDALAEEGGHLVGDQAADEIGGAARRKRHHDADRTAGKILRPGELRPGKLRHEQRRERHRGDQQVPNFAHNFLPVKRRLRVESGIRARHVGRDLTRPMPSTNNGP